MPVVTLGSGAVSELAEICVGIVKYRPVVMTTLGAILDWIQSSSTLTAPLILSIVTRKRAMCAMVDRGALAVARVIVFAVLPCRTFSDATRLVGRAFIIRFARRAHGIITGLASDSFSAMFNFSAVTAAGVTAILAVAARGALDDT